MKSAVRFPGRQSSSPSKAVFGNRTLELFGEHRGPKLFLFLFLSIFLPNPRKSQSTFAFMIR
jgi:hypothetical protein